MHAYEFYDKNEVKCLSDRVQKISLSLEWENEIRIIYWSWFKKSTYQLMLLSYSYFTDHEE